MAQKVCKFTKRGKSYLVSTAGISDSYAIRRSVMFPDEWVVKHSGGAVSKTGGHVAHVSTLAEGKKLVAYRLGCRWPARRK